MIYVLDTGKIGDISDVHKMFEGNMLSSQIVVYSILCI